MALVVAGINHKTAPIHIREKLNFNEEEVKNILSTLKNDPYFKEALIPSTCNRTEFYFVCENLEPFAEKFYKFISGLCDLDMKQLQKVTYTYYEEDAVNHIFRVSSGLESMMVGENQILGQVKNAYTLACMQNTNGAVINKLLHHSFRTGKRVRSETDIGKGAVSISSAATELALKIFSDIADKEVLLIGSGETGKLTASNLINRGIKKLYIINRTYERAVKLAKSLGATPLKWEDLIDTLYSVEIVISCTGARDRIIDIQSMKTVMSKREYKPLFIIDIAIPRDFDPEIDNLTNVFLHSIDDLKEIAEHNLIKRKAEIPKAENIIMHETKKFMKWYTTNKVSPLIIDLQRKVEEIRVKELEKNKNRFREEDWNNIDLLTRSIIKKIIKLPLLKIKEYTEDTKYGKLRLETVRDIFQLGLASLGESQEGKSSGKYSPGDSSDGRSEKEKEEN